MKARVLFVDDEAQVTDGLRVALRKAPFEVLTANSGAEALETLAAGPIDVVVSDERMPGMRGSELLARVRAEYPDTMRMILSGQSDLEGAVRAINEGGVFRFLLKPCEPDDLAASVGEALDALEQRRQYERWSVDRDGDECSDAMLDRALETIRMAFQPIYSRQTRSIHAYEALVRLRDPEVTSPDQLFGLAEALDRVPEVDQAIRHVLAESLPDLPEDRSLFVNLHPLSLFDDRITSAADPLAPWAARIVVEVTERSSLLESKALDARLVDLRQRGYRLALDDLGAGYAGLTSFALLMPDVVKFDMGLVRGIQDDPTRKRLIASMAALCHEMEIDTVAEGIETREELQAVASLGCDLLQGFLLAKPRADFER